MQFGVIKTNVRFEWRRTVVKYKFLILLLVGVLLKYIVYILFREQEKLEMNVRKT